MKKYLLAVERNHNDYIPIDWTWSVVNNNQDITSLKEIDKLTSSMKEEDLKNQFIQEHLLSEELLEKPLVIISSENGKMRKMTSSIVTPLEKEALEPVSISEFLLNNISRKQIINRIYNKFKDKEVSEYFKKILSCINGYQENSIVRFIECLSSLPLIPYEELRELGLFIKRELEPLLEEEKNKEMILAMENKKNLED